MTVRVKGIILHCMHNIVKVKGIHIKTQSVYTSYCVMVNEQLSQPGFTPMTMQTNSLIASKSDHLDSSAFAKFWNPLIF